jgi:predicted SPOUT superfamily RNA methylase MTH1
MLDMIDLPTWGGRSKFRYEGSIREGTTIHFGDSNKIFISAEDYEKLLSYFKGKEVNVGTSRTDPPKGSLGEWLIENISKVALASYVGAILTNEDYGIKEKSFMRFK